MNRWIGNLTLNRKFALIFALSLAMLAWPTTLAVRMHLATLNVARAEAGGIPPAGAVLNLLRLSQQHRGLSAMVLAGNADAAAKRQAKQGEVDKALQEAAQATAAMQSAGLDKRLAGITKDWQGLSGAVASGSLKGPDSFARHTALVGQQLALLDDIVDTSTLALDPEAGTYYLVMATLHHAPLLTEALGQLRARGAALLTLGTQTSEDKVRIAALVDAATIHANNLAIAMRHAREADSALHKDLSDPDAKGAAAAGTALKMTQEQFGLGSAPSLPAGDYFAQITRDIDAQFSLIDAGFKSLDQSLAQRVGSAQRELVLVCISILGFAALTLWVIALVARSTTTAMRRALDVAQTVARGDLSSKIHSSSRDEAGQLLDALNGMTEGLRGLVSQVRQSSDSIATGSTQIATGNTDLSQRTERQASSLQQTASAMDELTATVQRNADTARQANELAAQASSAAALGGTRVGDVVGTMQDISASSRRIADIIGTIDGIAFQTNILALNAAVEAARAGEQGRGFAVVASEVRSLAQRSAQAAREVRQLIQHSNEKVEAGARMVDDAGHAMQDIVLQVGRVAELIAEISASSAEQNQGIGEVGTAVQELDQMTQANAALVEQSAAAAESLNRQATRLSEVVGVFRLEAGHGGL